MGESYLKFDITQNRAYAYMARAAPIMREEAPLTDLMHFVSSTGILARHSSRFLGSAASSATFLASFAVIFAVALVMADLHLKVSRTVTYLQAATYLSTASFLALISAAVGAAILPLAAGAGVGVVTLTSAFLASGVTGLTGSA